MGVGAINLSGIIDFSEGKVKGESKRAKSLECKSYIDFDKQENQFFDNLYVEEYKTVIKLPLIRGKYKKSQMPQLRIEKFNLPKYTFLTSY